MTAVFPDPDAFYIGAGDTGPSIVEDLKNGDGSTLVVTGATVRFRLYDASGALVLDRPATVVDGALGRVRYDWQAADTAIAGEYLRKWVVTLANNQVVSVPDDRVGYLVLISDPATGWPVVPTTLVCQPWCSPKDVALVCSRNDMDPQLVVNAIAVASDLLFLFSGRQFPGLCADVGVRPNRVEWFGGRLIGSVSSTGEVFGLAPPRYSDYVSDRNLGAGPISEIRLPGYPVVSIQRVRVDGVTLPPTAYKIDDDRWLARVDGLFWPVIQDLTKDPATALGTMDVDYTFGAAYPPMARWAAAAYSGEIAKAWTPGADCSLPPRTQSVLRQGLSVRTLDPQDYVDNGKTGCRTADDFIKAVNPNHIQERASILSPDINWPAHRLR